MADSRLDFLLEAFTLRPLTTAEGAELMDLVADPAGEADLPAIVDRLMVVDGEELRLPERSAREILATILATKPPAREEDEGLAPAPVVELNPSRRRPFRWIAAAVILLGLGWGAARLWINKTPVPLPVVAKTPDLLPGSNRATLTLGNGQRLVLDSAAADTILTEGAAVVANADGKLAYQAGNQPQAEIVYNTLSTPFGGTYMLTLPDDSKVWLNALSTLRYPTAFTGETREVTMTGEAYFEVATDAKRPFTIHVAGRQDVAVLGTQFNVNAYPDEPELVTTLLEGAVKISRKQQGVPEVMLLHPGQQELLNATGMSLRPTPDAAAVLAWKNGYFSFHGETLGTIMRQVARWYDAEIVYEGNVQNEQFAGTVPRSANAAKLLEVLALTKTVEFTILIRR
jgi:transmembrane sensor